MKILKKTNTLIVFGYAIEFLLAGLVFIFLWQRGWLVPISKFLEDSAGSWATLFGLIFAGTMAARLVFFSLNSGEFSAWLEWKRLGGVFAGAFLFNVLLFLLVTGTNIVIIYVKGMWLTKAGIFVIILGLINSVTFSMLVYRFARLQAAFNFEFKRLTEAEVHKGERAN